MVDGIAELGSQIRGKHFVDAVCGAESETEDVRGSLERKVGAVVGGRKPVLGQKLRDLCHGSFERGNALLVVELSTSAHDSKVARNGEIAAMPGGEQARHCRNLRLAFEFLFFVKKRGFGIDGACLPECLGVQGYMPSVFHERGSRGVENGRIVVGGGVPHHMSLVGDGLVGVSVQAASKNRCRDCSRNNCPS